MNPIRDPARAEVIRALREGTNGHGLPLGAPPVGAGGQQIVQFNPMHTVTIILDSILPGHPMPIVVAPGQPPIAGTMIDWTEFADKVTASLTPDVASWTPEQIHARNSANAVAAFQRSAMALAEAARGIRETAIPPEDKLPEAPEEGSTRRPDPPGTDANGSPTE